MLADLHFNYFDRLSSGGPSEWTVAKTASCASGGRSDCLGLQFTFQPSVFFGVGKLAEDASAQRAPMHVHGPHILPGVRSRIVGLDVVDRGDSVEA